MKIVFVCHGNICRSPMAEFIFKKMVNVAGLKDKFEIISRATSAEELGNPVYPPARAELMRHGLSCDGKHAVQLTRSDYEKYDLFIGMDKANIRNMHRLFGGDPEVILGIRENLTSHTETFTTAARHYLKSFARICKETCHITNLIEYEKSYTINPDVRFIFKRDPDMTDNCYLCELIGIFKCVKKRST